MHRASKVGVTPAKICVVLFVGLAALSARSEARSAAGRPTFLWRVTPPATSSAVASYVLGSIHVAKKSMYPLPASIGQAFESSDELVVEARVDDPSAQIALMKEGLYLDGDTLEKHVSSKVVALLKKQLKGTMIPYLAASRMKPWMAAMTVLLAEIQKQGFDPKMGIDLHFLTQAKKRHMVIRELEGVAKQVALFRSFSSKEQEKFLYYSLVSAKETRPLMASLIDAWKRGAAKKMHRVMTASIRKHKDVRGVYKRVMTDRNVTMAKTIDDMIKSTRKKLFVVVGSGHLVGPKSILRLLEKKGYRVDQMRTTLQVTR